MRLGWLFAGLTAGVGIGATAGLLLGAKAAGAAADGPGRFDYVTVYNVQKSPTSWWYLRLRSEGWRSSPGVWRWRVSKAPENGGPGEIVDEGGADKYAEARKAANAAALAYVKKVREGKA